MASKSYAGSLAASLRSEAQAVEDRFAKAERAMAPRVPQERNGALGRGETQRKAVTSEKRSPAKGRIRDTFSFPPDDHALIRDLRMRCAKGGEILSRSEIVRTALHVLHGLSDEHVLEAVEQIEKLKPGPRPKK